MKTITGETDQSGRVVHTVEQDGDGVWIVTHKEAPHLNTFGWTVTVTPQHARDLAKVLMDCADEAERK